MLFIQDEQDVPANELLITDSPIKSSAEVQPNTVAHGSELVKCHHNPLSQVLILPDPTESRRCIECFRVRLLEFDICVDLLKDLKAFSFLVESTPQFCQLLAIFTPYEARVLLELLVNGDYNNNGAGSSVSSPLIHTATRLLKQLFSLGAPCVTPSLITTVLRNSSCIKPASRTELLTAVRQWIKLAPENAIGVQKDAACLLDDESFEDFSRPWIPATVSAFAVLTDIIEHSRTDRATLKRYVDLSLDILARVNLSQVDTLNSSNVGGMAIRGLSVVASSQPQCLFEPASSVLVKLFEKLHAFSQPAVFYLCGLLTTAVKTYGTATPIVARTSFDCFLGDSIKNSPPLDVLITIIDCLVGHIERYQL